MVKQRTEKQIDRYNRYGSPSQWLGAITVGLTSGAITMFNLVSTKFHNDLSSDFKMLELFKKEKPDLDLSKMFKTKVPKDVKIELLKFDESKIQEALKTDAQKIPKVLQRQASNTTSDFMAQMRGAKHEYREFTKRVAQFGLGIESYGFKGVTKGTWQRLMTFSPNSRFNTIVKGLFAMGGGIGATLMVFNQLNNRDKLNEIDKVTERSDRKIDALIEKLGVEPDAIKTRLENKQAIKDTERAEHERDVHNQRHPNELPALSIAGERRHEGMQRDAALELGA